MFFNLSDLPPKDRYKLLTALVIPRPIALVSTRSLAGIINIAPYSFFNVFSQDPAVCVIGIERPDGADVKDTAANIENTAEFVVNLVNEDIAEAMNICAVNFPSNVSEAGPAGFATEPSSLVGPPRVAEAPAALECRLHTTLMLGTARRLAVGEIVAAHVKDSIWDSERMHLRLDAYRPIGRLFGNLYCRTRDHFELVRESYKSWSARHEKN